MERNRHARPCALIKVYSLGLVHMQFKPHNCVLIDPVIKFCAFFSPCNLEFTRMTVVDQVRSHVSVVDSRLPVAWGGRTARLDIVRSLAFCMGGPF